MRPCLVRNENKTLVFGLQLALLVEVEGLCVGGEGLNSGVHDFLGAHLELRLLVDEYGEHVALRSQSGYMILHLEITLDAREILDLPLVSGQIVYRADRKESAE